MDACAIREGRVPSRRAMQAVLTAGLIACSIGVPTLCVAAAPEHLVARHLHGREPESAEAACPRHVTDLKARTGVQPVAPAPQTHRKLNSLPDGVGWIAAGLTLLTFYCTQAQHLRMFALSANLAFILYGFFAALWPVLVLHLLLLPINLLRLRSALRESAAGMARSAPSAQAHEPWFKQSGKRFGS